MREEEGGRRGEVANLLNLVRKRESQSVRDESDAEEDK